MSQQEDWHGAIDCWKQAAKCAEFKLHDDDMLVKMRLNLALGYLNIGKPHKTILQCTEILKRKSDNADSPFVAEDVQAKAGYRAALAWWEIGQHTRAISSLKIVIQADPKCHSAREKLTSFTNELKQNETSLWRGRLVTDTTSVPSAAVDRASTDPPKIHAVAGDTNSTAASTKLEHNLSDQIENASSQAAANEARSLYQEYLSQSAELAQPFHHTPEIRLHGVNVRMLSYYSRRWKISVRVSITTVLAISLATCAALLRHLLQQIVQHQV